MRASQALHLLSILSILPLLPTRVLCADPPKRWSSSFRLQFDARAGFHFFAPRDLATHRYSLLFSQEFKSAPHWTIKASGRGWAETAYISNPERYPSAFAKQGSGEARLTEAFIQYRGGPLVLTTGYQQVAWGETFGFFLADIVNPKDLREFVLDDLSSLRLPVLAANMLLTFGSGSIQAVFVPRGGHHLLPQPGSDFAPDSTSLLPGAALTFNDEPDIPWRISNSEAGLRASVFVGGVDFAAYYYYYLDRFPNYTTKITSLSPLAVSLNPEHTRVRTFGMTATADLSLALFRVESVYTKDRAFDFYRNGAYSSEKSDELAYAVEMNFHQFEFAHVEVQWAQNLVQREIPGNLTLGTRNTASVHFMKTVNRDHALQLTFAHGFQEQGSMLRGEYKMPFSSATELKFAGDFFLGPQSGPLGMLRDASRIYAQLTAYVSR